MEHLKTVQIILKQILMQDLDHLITWGQALLQCLFQQISNSFQKVFFLLSVIVAAPPVSRPKSLCLTKPNSSLDLPPIYARRSTIQKLVLTEEESKIEEEAALKKIGALVSNPELGKSPTQQSIQDLIFLLTNPFCPCNNF